MKKLLSLLAVAALLPVAANAEVLSNVNLKGEIQTIASDVKNSEATYVRGTSARVLAGLSADLVEDVTANLMFQYANIWGSDNASGRSVQDYWDNVTLVEANVVLHNLFCCLEATVGRQFYGDEDSAVMYIGPNHYNAEYNGYTQSLDALKLTYGDDVKALTVIAGRVNNSFDNSTVNGFAPLGIGFDYGVFGADFRMNLTDALTAQVYGYDLRNIRDPLTGDVIDSDSGFYGVKLALNPEDGIRLAAEYARNFGGDRLIKEHHDTGDMVKVDAAVDVEAITVRGTFYRATENFFALGNYTPGLLIGHILNGDLAAYSDDEGVSMFNLGFDMKPADKWTVSLDGFSFQTKDLKHTATYEADVTAKYAHNENVELFAGVGYVNYAKMFGMDQRDNVKGQLGMLIKF